MYKVRQIILSEKIDYYYINFRGSAFNNQQKYYDIYHQRKKSVKLCVLFVAQCPFLVIFILWLNIY